MSLYTVKIQGRTWSGKAANMGAAIKEAANSFGFDLSDKVNYMWVRK